MTRSAAGLIVTLLAACPARDPAKATIPPVSTGKVRVRVFAEPSPVRQLAQAGRFVFVGTDSDLERWDGAGEVLPLSAEHGLSGTQIVALGSDLDRRGVWVLTDAGLGFYDTAAESYLELPAPPDSVGVSFAALAQEGASVAAAVDGGVWLGTKAGLIYASADSGWASTPIKDPILAMVRDRAGWLWLATKAGLIARRPTGETVHLGEAEGCAIAEPRLLVELPGDRMLAIGSDELGRDRLAFGKQLQWSTYRALPEVRWDAAARRGNGAVVLASDRLYRIAPADPARVRPLARDGMRLVPVVSGAGADWTLDPVDVQVPAGALSLGAVDDQLLIGTRDLGTARYEDGEALPRVWLRRRAMFRDATGLWVACAKAEDCWIATGARGAWHWLGDRFVAGGPDQVVLAVVREPSGAIYALHRADGEAALRISRLEGATWTAMPRVAIAAPGAPELSFARFGAGGLWLGLRYRDGDDVRPWGIAIVDVASGKVAYHRTEDGAASIGGKKMMAVPNGVIDGDVRGDVAWLATEEGVARIGDGRVETWPEPSGSPGEPGRALAIAADGSVIVATSTGASLWNGKAWEAPASLRFGINDVVATRNGQVWMATAHGIVAWDGRKVRRVDTRRGLAENEIVDVAVDHLDRVWARGNGSLTLISQ